MKRGVSLALNTVGIAILVLVVVLVLGFIFLGYAGRLVGLEDKCGDGMYAEYSCVEERPETGFPHCFYTSREMCAVGEVGDGVRPLCCRRG